MNHKYEILLLIFGGLKSLHNVINSCISSGSFTVTSEGCKVVLACGIHFYFPPGAAPDPLQIYFRSLTPDPQWVKLRHHDVLLSRVLELQPHGVQFQQVRIHPGAPPDESAFAVAQYILRVLFGTCETFTPIPVAFK